MKDAPQPLSVQKGKPVDTGIERVSAQEEDDAESSLSSEEGTARNNDDDPDFAPEHGYTPLVEEAPGATSRTYSLSFVNYLSHTSIAEADNESEQGERASSAPAEATPRKRQRSASPPVCTLVGLTLIVLMHLQGFIQTAAYHCTRRAWQGVFCCPDGCKDEGRSPGETFERSRSVLIIRRTGSASQSTSHDAYS